MDNAHEFFHCEAKNTDPFAIEDLLDLPNDDSTMVVAQGGAGGCFDPGATSSTAVENYSLTAEEPNYSSFMDSELCVPYDDLAELEWHIAEDYSFSNDEFQKLQLIQGLKSSSTQPCHFQPDNPVPVPAKARSKRSRAASGSCWTSRLLTDVKSSSEQQLEEFVVRKPDAAASKNSEAARRCQHCSAEKTPQWRTGPMGPKTLCNACGVRYKSGRLVPEYRPAASPTFVLTKHSNSHRKVLELRRQKEMIRVQQQQHQHQFLQHNNHMFDHCYHHHHHVGNGEDYKIHPQSIETATYDHMMI